MSIRILTELSFWVNLPVIHVGNYIDYNDLFTIIMISSEKDLHFSSIRSIKLI
jgi:hypothetical protein